MDAGLLTLLLERDLGLSLDEATPGAVSGWNAVEILWPLNEVFRPRLPHICTVAYRPQFETEADDAIKSAAFAGNCDGWEGLSAGAWRVLLERYLQAQTVALANEAAGNHLMVLPLGLSARGQRGAVMLYLLHGMTLPWAPSDRSSLELPQGPPVASMRLH